MGRRLVLAGGCLLLSAPTAALTAAADQPPGAGSREEDETGSRGGQLITLDELPLPPPPIGRLIESAGVRFRVGGKPPRTDIVAGNRRADGDFDRRDPKARDRGGVVGRSSTVSEGMTAYRVSFEYDSENRWRVVGAGRTRRLVVNVRFLDVRWRTTHEVWLRRPIPADRFWEDPLVLHELDHVRISADRSLQERFAKRLGERAELRIPLAARATVTSRGVQVQIDRHVRQTHQLISELIEIRYRELDRLTAHGQRPIPAGTELGATLRRPKAALRRPKPGADGQPVGQP